MLRPFPPSLLQPLAAPDLSTVSIVSPFPERNMVGITQMVPFSDWLLSLHNIHLRFLLAIA